MAVELLSRLSRLTTRVSHVEVSRPVSRLVSRPASLAASRLVEAA